MMKKMLGSMIILLLLALMAGCSESWERQMKDMKSEYGGGLNRTVTVYSATGTPLATYKGKFDIEADTTGSGKVEFDMNNGKRVIIYNATVITEEE